MTEFSANPCREQRTAYLLLRLFTGLDFFMHGFARIFTGTHLSGFAEGMVKSMSSAPLPVWLTLATGYVVPCVEIVVGTLLLLGIFARVTLQLAFILMFVLLFGVTLKQDWSTASQQLLYAVVLFVLLYLHKSHDVSWTALFRRG